MTIQQETVSEVIARQLADAGIETVFGLPGGENVEIMAALKRYGLTFVLVHNESSAVYMADATARISGKPGVCLTTLGPGVTNAAAGVGHAYLDRAPLIIITACTWEALRPDHTHQYIDQTRLFEPITKGTFTLSPENVHETVAAALSLCSSGRPGPVHLQVSRPVAAEMAVSNESPQKRESAINEEMTIAIDELEKARAALRKAKRPLVLVGLGLEPERPYEALRELAEAANAPVVVTPKAKGALAADHPLYAGTVGLGRTDPVYEILGEADCIVTVGYDVVELVKPWDEIAPLIWMATWANEDPRLPAVAELAGPLEPALQQLADMEFATESAWGAARVATFHAAQSAKTLPEPVPGRMQPQSVLKVLRAQVPRNTLITTDVGSHKILTSLTWPALTPNSFMLSNGLSCMGFGLPAAIAASLALGKQPTISVTGDGGFAMIMGELNLIRELEVPVIIVVMNDCALDLIRAAQNRAGKETFGTEFTNPDFVKIAEAYGIPGHRVTTENECTAAVSEAIAANQPVLIEAMIDPVSYPTTPEKS